MERENVLESYLNKYIDKKARVTSKLAAKTPNPESDPVIDEAVYFDSLANEPTPWIGADNDEPYEGGSNGDES